ncbi:MAG: membrane glycosyltransferase MdoH [Saliniramus fredricksonii]|uniref:Glucans biosynthesis glucosyltransferase H n=1 Tax=Saliniramus fredricksonii TaxID=1653334 RepID=A0A0P7YAH0_9HYPH|nr:MAG: membrane glycosyltransferase MdoH [Saliniramus fredricksonii]SCC78023.1 membrane glycosyltransferase [Saliniramus fredricksonii]
MAVYFVWHSIPADEPVLWEAFLDFIPKANKARAQDLSRGGVNAFCGRDGLPQPHHENRRLARRRALFFSLVALTALAALAALALVLGQQGLSAIDLAMLAVFAVTLPWTVIGFWNAVFGLIIALGRREPLDAVAPLAGRDAHERRLIGHTAIVVPAYDEDPQMVLGHIEATIDDLEDAGGLDNFEIFLLSDTQDSFRAAEEMRAVQGFCNRIGFADRFHYRRRSDNAGHKTGNLWEWLERRGADFDYMIVLDADSLMSGGAIRRLVRVMDCNPNLGICQTLIAGLPSRVAFTRMFQFGMRHGMRAYALGAAWWQGPAGPYWGHNAIIRIDAFMRHCRLPTLPGRGPLSGLVLSHDQLEAAQMVRGGYDVRVLPDEYGSYEINPPCLPEFVRRSLRWCQGNLQYLKLVTKPGWPPMARLQLALAILMYLSGPAWLLFMGLGFMQGALGVSGGAIADNPWGAAPSGLGLWLLAGMIVMVFAPKLAGLIDALADSRRRRSYGGGFRLLSSGIAEFLHGMLLAPIMAIAEALFILGLARGKGLTWKVQRRHGFAVTWRESIARFWPQTAIAALALTGFWLHAPQMLPWIIPVAIGPLSAILFCRFGTNPALGRMMARRRFAAIPEDIIAPPVVARAMRIATVADRSARIRAAAPALTPLPQPAGE